MLLYALKQQSTDSFSFLVILKNKNREESVTYENIFDLDIDVGNTYYTNIDRQKWCLGSSKTPHLPRGHNRKSSKRK
jgi:hypothetical protein